MRSGDKKSLTEDVTSVLTMEGQGAIYTETWGEGIAGRGNSICKGPGTRISSMSFEGKTGAEYGWDTVRGWRMVDDEVREVGGGQIT